MTRSLWIAILCVSSLGLTFAQDVRPHRFMNRSQPLWQQIEGERGPVEITINQDEPSFLRPPAGTSWERFQSDASDFVLIVRVESLRPHLVYRADMDESVETDGFSSKSEAANEDRANWIMSTVLIKVEQVLKGEELVKQGEQLLFEEDGGSLMLRGVKVDAVVPWHTALQPGKRYLWFGSPGPHGKMWRNAMYVEPAPGQKLVSVTNHGRQRKLEQLTLTQAVAYLRDEIRR